MGKVISAAIVAMVAFVLIDQQLNNGLYMDAMLTVVRQLRHSFG